MLSSFIAGSVADLINSNGRAKAHFGIGTCAETAASVETPESLLQRR